MRGLRRVLGGFVEDLLHVGGDGAEIAALRGAVNLDHRLDVVLRIDRRRRVARLMSAMRAQHLRRRAWRGDRQVAQRVQRIDLILRRLHHDRVVHAVFGIEPEGRLHLARSGEVDHHAVGDVAFGDADILRARAVDVDVEGRFAERLLDARVDQAGNVAQSAQQVLRVGEILVEIGSANLHFDRRRRAEIQDLADDVGRQERKRRAREARRQFLAQRADVLGGRPVILAQADLDLAVLRADGAGVVVGHVDAADRQADIVDQRFQLVRRDDLADDLLDFGKLPRVFLDARADLRAHMHQNPAAVDRRKEIAAEIGRQRERADHEGQESR